MEHHPYYLRADALEDCLDLEGTPVTATKLMGKKPALFPAEIKDLTWYAAGNLPTPPASVAVPQLTWDMDGNDTYGDCGVAGIKHGFQAAAADSGQHDRNVTDKQVVDYYLKYTGGQDEGVVLSDFLAYVKKNSFYGKNVRAYAPVKVHDIPTLQFAIDAYDFAYTGIAVTQAMMNAFDNGQPWDMSHVGGQVEGGHCIPLVGYDSNWLYAVTWGAIQKIAYSAWTHISDEAWAVLTGEIQAMNSDGHGIAYNALVADISKLD